jgi:hypothetical protein
MIDLKSIIFWDMKPCSLLSCWFAEPISSTLKMEAISSSETSGATQRTTWRHIPEDDTLHNHHCENLKSYMDLEHQILHRQVLLLVFEVLNYFKWQVDDVAKS